MFDKLRHDIRAIRRDYLGAELTLRGKRMSPLRASAWLAVRAAPGIFFAAFLLSVMLHFLPFLAPVTLMTSPKFFFSFMGVALAGMSVAVPFKDLHDTMQRKTAGILPGKDGVEVRLFGPGRQLTVIENTQRLIDKATARFANADQLPARVIRKLTPHLKDSVEALKGVEATRDTEPLDRIDFLRTVFNAKGEEVKAVVASFDTAFGIERALQDKNRLGVEKLAKEFENGADEPVQIYKPLQLKISR